MPLRCNEGCIADILPLAEAADAGAFIIFSVFYFPNRCAIDMILRQLIDIFAIATWLMPLRQRDEEAAAASQADR